MKHQGSLWLGIMCCIGVGTFGKPDGTYRGPQTSRADSVTVRASNRYHKPGLLRRVMIGANYRQVWGTPVTMPVFNLAASGLQMGELGGGQQTKSLRLKDASGKQWVLRTVDKDVEKAMPERLRNTIAEQVVQDLISAANPYAPLVVAHLAKAIRVPAPDPQLYFVPDDPAFGANRAIFASRICYLEERDPTWDGSESENSEHLQEQLGKKNKVLVLQPEVLQARLLDMLIADWDRHADQWRWGKLDSAKATYYYAIPRDRDQAFFRAGGLIPRVGKAIAMQHLNWFKKDMRGLSKLNYKSRDFDRLYLNDLDRKDWEDAISLFTAGLSDQVIDAAVAELPPAAQPLVGKELASRLKSRRNDMKKPVLHYYQQLAREVQVWGSKEKELFELSDQNGLLQVKVFAVDGKGAPGLLRYERLFDAKETKMLHLEGLGGADQFLVQSLPRKTPEIHLYGNGAETKFAVTEQNKKRINIHKQAISAVPGAGKDVTKKEN